MLRFEVSILSGGGGSVRHKHCHRNTKALVEIQMCPPLSHVIIYVIVNIQKTGIIFDLFGR